MKNAQRGLRAPLGCLAPLCSVCRMCPTGTLCWCNRALKGLMFPFSYPLSVSSERIDSHHPLLPPLRPGVSPGNTLGDSF